MPKQRRSESGKEAMMSRGMDGPEKSEMKVEDKGEPEEAAAEIESDGRRNEIADEANSLSCVLKPQGLNHCLMVR